MISKNIENIIVKFLSNECSIFELEELEMWLEEANNEKIFREYVKLNYLIDINTNEFNDLATKTIIRNTFREQNRTSVRQLKIFAKYAAAIAILVATALYFFRINTEEPLPRFPNEVVLETESGKIKILKNNAISTIKSEDGVVLGKQNGKVISYKSDLKLDKLIFNRVKVPYGKKLAIHLSDGTKVNLNSGTVFKFPVSFLPSSSRQVFVEEGEAFFDVTHNKEQPFIVNNKNINVEVLGTKFNFSSYPEDKFVTTVLVEGSVQLTDSKTAKNKVLKPGFKGAFEKETNKIEVSEADVSFHTAWLKGKIIMKHMEFSSIVKKLERHYDVSIDNRDSDLDKEIISATFEGESIEQVLELINKIHPIHYEIDGKNIEITAIKN